MCETTFETQPWDVIRERPPVTKKPPLRTGCQWFAGPWERPVTLERCDISMVKITSIKDSLSVSPGAARDIGKFLIECADQAEGK